MKTQIEIASKLDIGDRVRVERVLVKHEKCECCGAHKRSFTERSVQVGVIEEVYLEVNVMWYSDGEAASTKVSVGEYVVGFEDGDMEWFDQDYVTKVE